MPHISADEKAWAIIVAAGSGSRMGDECGGPKQFLQFGGYPLYWHSALAFSRCACIAGIVFVFPAEFVERENKKIAAMVKRDNFGVLWHATCGGPTRRDSARLGLAQVPLACKRVMIHDAARPFISSALIQKIYDALDARYGAVIPGLPVTDTIKFVSPDGIVDNTPQRDRLFAVQTPQIFQAPLLREAHLKAAHEELAVTDDATLLEMLGYKVRLIPGNSENIKITTPADLKMLKQDNGMDLPMPCNGFGYDVHKFGSGRPLKLGGVSIPGDLEVIAHSDGDVLLHALADAILGCAALGDIGAHFPDTDEKFENISSAVLLDHVLGLARGQGIEICHADITVVAQQPKLAPWKREIAKNVARLCAIPVNRVNIKATTEESMGFTGRKEGIKAYALVSAIRHPKGVRGA